MQPPTILFDANGPIGCGATAAPEYRTPADLLDRMDRLGIARALVWSVPARDHHPALGNQQLLADLDALPAAQRDRLVPSLVIASAMLYENHSTDELVELVRSNGTRALRVFPGTLRHRLRHLDPVLQRVQEYQPVIFVDVREVPEERDLLEFAQAYPQLPIVVLHGMWGHLYNYSLLDLVARCPNIHLDNSWQHTRGTLEQIVRDHGPERVVFGTGTRAQNGAAIAHLQHALLTDDQKDQIAHRNLERLLGLGPTRPAAAGLTNPLWADFRAGKKPPVPIIDAHAHLGSEGLWAVPERDVAEQLPVVLQYLDRVGIETLIVSVLDALFTDPLAGNRKLEQLAGGCGDRIHGYFVFNPFYEQELLPALEEFFARPFFVGLKTLCDYWGVPVTDPRFRRAYQYAHDRRLPILLHTWDGNLDSPAMLAPVVKEYPDATFLLGHSGGGDRGRREAEELARAHPNVVLEFCGSFCSRIPWEETIPRVPPGQIVFGTDGAQHDFAWELGRFLSIDLPPETLVPILGQNMRRILARRR